MPGKVSFLVSLFFKQDGLEIRNQKTYNLQKGKIMIYNISDFKNNCLKKGILPMSSIEES